MEGIGHYPGTRHTYCQEAGLNANRSLQSLGWEHYEVHEPEPHILLFKYSRPLNLLQKVADQTCRRPANYVAPGQ